MLTPASQLVMRSAEQFPGRRMLIVNPPEDELGQSLARAGVKQATLFSLSWSGHQHHELRAPDGFDTAFGTLPGPGDHDTALVFLPREKALKRLLLRSTAAVIKAGCPIWLVGENRAGAKSAGRLLAEVTRSWSKVDSARHCTIYRGQANQQPTAVSLDDFARRWPVTVGEVDLTLVSLPGVFSHGALDEATRMLLENLPPLSGRILDFGCGNGVIGAYAAARCRECRVHLVDDNALALEAARLTFEANGIDAASISPASGLSDVGGRFDFILSNPPFHRGVDTDYRAAEALIDKAPEHLAAGGRLLIVANAFLDYPRRMERRLGNSNTRAANRRFRVYDAALAR